MSADEAREKAERLVTWLSDQTYQGEPLLHAVVCCDFVSRERFVAAVARQLAEG